MPSRPAGLAVDDHRVGPVDRPLARERGEQFALAVAGDAGDGDHLAAVNSRLMLLQRRRRRDRPDGRSSEPSARRTGPSAAGGAGHSSTSAPTISRASVAAVSFAGSVSATTLPRRRIVA